MIREPLRIIIILAVSAMVGFVLLILAYCLPYNRIRHNVARTSYSFNTEGIYPELAQGYYSYFVF